MIGSMHRHEGDANQGQHSKRHQFGRVGRRVLHFNITRHPTAEWVMQQLREAFPEAGPYRYVILDHDSKFDADVIAFLKATGLEPKRMSVQAPWQNGIAERWVGSCRREILDHVIPLNEQHLRRLIPIT